MPRLLVFIAFSVFVVLALNLRNFHSLPVKNETFNFQEYAKQQEEREGLIADLKRQQYEMEHGLIKPEEKEEFEAEKVVVLENDSERRGQEIYNKRCVVCHGKMGDGKKSQNAPKLAGQYDWYIYNQLVAMKTKARSNPVMDPYIRPLGDDDFKDLSAYIAKLTW